MFPRKYGPIAPFGHRVERRKQRAAAELAAKVTPVKAAKKRVRVPDPVRLERRRAMKNLRAKAWRARMRVQLAKPEVTGAALFSEGVVEVGACAGTNVLFVKTVKRLVLLYADQVASLLPILTPKEVRRARDYLDAGRGGEEVARCFGFNVRNSGGMLGMFFHQLKEAQ